MTEHPYKEYMQPLTPSSRVSTDSLDSLKTKWRSRSVPVKKDDDKILQVNVTVNCNCDKKKAEPPPREKPQTYYLFCPLCKNKLKFTPNI